MTRDITVAIAGADVLVTVVESPYLADNGMVYVLRRAPFLWYQPKSAIFTVCARHSLSDDEVRLAVLMFLEKEVKSKPAVDLMEWNPSDLNCRCLLGREPEPVDWQSVLDETFGPTDPHTLEWRDRC